MNKLTYSIPFLFSLLLIACGTTKEMSTETKQINFEIMHSNMLTGGGSEGIEESFVVCNTQAELDSIKGLMNKVNKSTKALDAIDVNFDTETVLAYFQPVRSSGGYTLTADSLVQTSINGKTSCSMHYSVQSPQGDAITILTQPYIFIKTKKLGYLVTHKVTEAAKI